MLVIILIILASAVFIMVNVFRFALDAYESGKAKKATKQLIKESLVMIFRFVILAMFTLALVIGTLVPLGLLYIILAPGK